MPCEKQSKGRSPATLHQVAKSLPFRDRRPKGAIFLLEKGETGRLSERRVPEGKRRAWV